MTAARVFAALGDSTRLEIVQRIARSQPCSIASVSEGLGISRQGARKHVQVLVDARLVLVRQEGREMQLRLDAAALEHAKTFLTKLERQWDRRLEALRRSIEEG